jgi:alkylhydroperoxidase/carboxymuconolactone decarboxylase family protein YurZ
MLEKAGFSDAQMAAETGFNSSPKTKGTLVRATKAGVISKERSQAQGDLLCTYQAFFDQTYAQGVLDRKTKHLIALGVSLAAGCEA